MHAEDINKENMARYDMREARGVGITEVVKDSPAEKAGLRKDDVIVRFEGDSVTSARKLTRLVSEVAPDQTVNLAISRSGGEQEVSVTIGQARNKLNAFHRLEGLKTEGFKKFEGMDKLEGTAQSCFHRTARPEQELEVGRTRWSRDNRPVLFHWQPSAHRREHDAVD